MSQNLIPLKPHEAAARLEAGRALLVDIREPDEFARRRVPGALSRPLSRFESGGPLPTSGKAVVFTCLGGGRTAAHGARLARGVEGEAYVLEGGLEAWAAAGLPVESDRRAPLELMRQVQIAAGLLVLAGVGFGVVVHPAFLALSAFVGGGLTFAGVTGFCGMARLLARAPWNAHA